MKWTNKGHEFDRYKQLFLGKKTYLYGYGQIGKYCFELLKGNVEGVFDKNAKEIESPIVPVNLPEKINTLDKNKSILILSMSDDKAESLVRVLTIYGWELGKNLFTFSLWNRLFNFYAFYHDGKLILKEFAINISKHCTLHCQECSQRMPYQCGLEESSIDQLKEDADLLFAKVDSIRNLAITGGEPLLFGELEEYLRYLGQNYGSKIRYIRVVTNGTILPKLSLLGVMRTHGITMEVTKYNVPQSKWEEISCLCEAHGVKMLVNEHEYWFKMWEEQKERDREWHFHNCIANSNCTALIDGKISRCLCGYFASLSIGDIEVAERDVLSLRDKTVSKEILFEYLEGYCSLGYLKACEMCNGLYGVNENKIEVGCQMKEYESGEIIYNEVDKQRA